MILFKKGQGMNFLDRFSLEDVAIVFIGLVIVSIIRIWFDSHVNRKKAKQFGSSLGIYNSLLDSNKEGLLIIADDNNVIYTNNEAADILNTEVNSMEADYLSTVLIENIDSQSKENLLSIIYSQTHIPNAQLSDSMAISISINKIKPYTQSDDIWYIVIIQNMTSINELRDGARNLLDA